MTETSNSSKGQDVVLVNNSSKEYSNDLPVIIAEGGGGLNVDWAKEKKKATDEGGEFFYNPCSQEINAIRASSTLPNQGNRNYNPANIWDYDPMTAWVEGAEGYGKGEYFEFRSRGANKIYNGYQHSIKGFLDNSRVKQFKVYKDGKPLCVLELKDEMGGQYFKLPGAEVDDGSTQFTYRFEILEVYEGNKWPDVAISELEYSTCCLAMDTHIEGLGATLDEAVTGLANEKIMTINLKTGATQFVQIEKSTIQKHLDLLEISTQTKTVKLTYDHPIFIKGIGFTSIGKYLSDHQLKDVYALAGKVDVLTWNAYTRKTEFEKIYRIVQHEGLVNTYSILKLSTGETYVANGFVSKTY